MKVAMKLNLIMTSLICTIAYGAERAESFDNQKLYTKIFSDFLEKTNNMNPESMKKYEEEITQQTVTRLAKETITAYIALQQEIPANFISNADAETAELANAHNKNLRQQLLQNQQK